MVLTNDELNQQLRTLQSGMAVVESTVEGLLPTITKNAADTKSLVDDINTKLQQHLDPIVSADVIASMRRLNETRDEMSLKVSSEIASVNSKMDNMKSQMEDSVASSKTFSDHTLATLAVHSQQLQSMTQEFRRSRKRPPLRKVPTTKKWRA